MNRNIYKVIPSTESSAIKGVSENKEWHSEGFSQKNPEQKDSSLSLTVTRGFTLAETLIVLVILGIIASITIPAVVRRQMEANNRARIKKAMTVYDTAINKFIIENQLKSDAAVYQIAPKNNCTLTSQYFKAVENIEENGNKKLCKFKSADGVWWDISDILNPMIALKKDELGTDAETSFKLSAKFDQNGSLRVDDLAYETKLNSDDLEALEKIYAFINNKEIEEADSSYVYLQSQIQKYKNGDFNKPCENVNRRGFYCTSCFACQFCNYYDNVVECGPDSAPYIFDENGNPFGHHSRYIDGRYDFTIQSDNKQSGESLVFFHCDFNDITKCESMNWSNKHIYASECEPYNKYNCNYYEVYNEKGAMELEKHNIKCTPEYFSDCVEWDEESWTCIKEEEIFDRYNCTKP